MRFALLIHCTHPFSPIYPQACAAIHLAARDCHVDNDMPEGPWWRIFCGRDCSLALSTIINALVGLTTPDQQVMEVASVAFIKSVGGAAFNDPDSYLWDQSD